MEWGSRGSDLCTPQDACLLLNGLQHRAVQYPGLVLFSDSSTQHKALHQHWWLCRVGMEKTREGGCCALWSVSEASSLTCSINSHSGVNLWVLQHRGLCWGGETSVWHQATALTDTSACAILLSFIPLFSFPLKMIKSWAMQRKKWHFFSDPCLKSDMKLAEKCFDLKEDLLSFISKYTCYLL